MKAIQLLLSVIFLITALLIANTYPQDSNFECTYYEEDEYKVPPEFNPPQPVGSVNMVVIYAVFKTPVPPPYIAYYDSLPNWYDELRSKMQNFFQVSSNGLHNLNVTILTDGDKPFHAADDIKHPEDIGWDGIYDNISDLFLSSVMEAVDAHYPLGNFDNDGPDGIPNSGDDDGYVDFVSLNVLFPYGMGGVGLGSDGNHSSFYTSQDISQKPGFGNIRIPYGRRGAIQQLVYTQVNNEGIPVHEYGHAMGKLPDMDHESTTYFNHYALGAFDVMSGSNFQGVYSIYNPWFRDDKLHWITPIQITGNRIGESMTDLLNTQKLIKYAPSMPPNTLSNQKYYVSYHTGVNDWEKKWPLIPTSVPGGNGGIMIWHVTDGGSYYDRRRLPIDIEAAHGKFNWTEDDYGVYNTGVANANSGFDSLEIRKIATAGDRKGKEIQGPYFHKDQGSASILYVPNSGKYFSLSTNPNSNYYHNISENFAQNVVSGFTVKNIIRSSGITSVDLYINDYTITSNTTFAVGTWYINNSITVSAGVSLTIQPGTILYFENGASLSVNGTLYANGGSLSTPVIFDFISPNTSTKNGIKFNSGSSGFLSYCNISNGYYGVYCNGSGSLRPINYCTISNNKIGIYLNNVGTPINQISHNTITANSFYGIYMYSSLPKNICYNTISDNMYGVRCEMNSTPYLYYNIIENNSCGIFCYGTSPAHFTNSNGDSLGHNVVKWNGAGISAGNGSHVFLGFTNKRGLNSVYDNTSYEVLAAYSSNIIARYNWWGTNPHFQTSYGGTIDHSFALPSDPNGGMGKAAVIANSDQEGIEYEVSFEHAVADSDTTQVFDSEFEEALSYLVNDKFEEAIIQYLQKFKKEKNTRKRIYALEQLVDCYRSAEKNDFIDFLDKEIRPNLSKNSEIYAKTIELENLFLISDRKYEKAIENYTVLRNNFSNYECIYKQALFNMWYIYYNELRDTLEAKGCLSELQTRYPDDDLTLHCLVLLGEINSPRQFLTRRSHDLGKKELVSESKVPEKYTLLGNYPNPFNPMTTIKYALPYQSVVEIVIYDIMGRQVKSFTISSQSPGYQGIIWNGANENGRQVSSGIYLYRINIKSLENNEVFVKTSKLILLK